MSIRLKKVQWDKSVPGSAIANIGGAVYTVYHSGGSARGFVNGNTRLGTFRGLGFAKRFCEQHALERIKEAVEVVDDHIPDATKMIEADSWQPTLERMLDKYQRLNAMYADDEAMHKHRSNIIAAVVSGTFRVASCMTIYDLERLITGEEIDFPDHLPKPPKEVNSAASKGS